MTIKQVGIIGAGTMGHALALVHALGGCHVRLQDNSEEALALAPNLIRAACDNLREAGEIDEQTADAALARIVIAPALADAVCDADLVVEAVVEKRDVKIEVFAAVDAAAPDQAIIASNTSYLDVFPLVPAHRQSRALIAHWYTPPYIIDLVDIAAGPETSPDVMTTIESLYRGFGKEPILFERLIPGYIANRLQAALNLECLRMIDEGWVSHVDIDRSIQHGLASRLATLGHMKKMDYTDLRMSQNGLASRTYIPPENKGGSDVLSKLIAAGKTGVRAGHGFYDYADATPEELFKSRDTKLIKLKQFMKTLEEEDTK